MMESDQSGYDTGKVSRRDRWKGKLFGKDRHNDEAGVTNVHDFLNSAADTLQVTHSTPANIPSPGRSPGSAFSNGGSGGPPRLLAKIDTTAAPRYPQAISVNDSTQNSYNLSVRANQPLSQSRGFGQLAPSPDFRSSYATTQSAQATGRPKKNKGLHVHFTEMVADIIGEGGDECEEPTMVVSRRKMARIAAGRPPPAPIPGTVKVRVDDDLGFQPRALKRTQTGYAGPMSDSPPAQPSPPRQRIMHPEDGPIDAVPRYSSGSIRSPDENRRSFIEMHQQEMRLAEGRALAKARSTKFDDVANHSPSPPSSTYSSRAASPVAREVSPEIPTATKYEARYEAVANKYEGMSARYEASPPSVNTLVPIRSRVSPQQVVQPLQKVSSYSPNSQSSYAPRSPYMGGYPQQLQQSIDLSRNGSTASQREPPSAYTETSYAHMIPETPSVADNHEFVAFVSRTKHLFELFRLHAETSGPLQYCDLRILARAALWWFLRGRQGLEILIRNRGQAAQQDELQYTMEKQQAYANLSKAYWLCEEAVPEVMKLRGLPAHPEVEEVRSTVRTSLRKLTVSMMRNDFMPPEEPFLPQTTDKFIWVEYPKIPQDVLSVLTSSAPTSLLSNAGRQSGPKALTVLESLPLGDTTENFNFSRVLVDAVLFEQGTRESQGLTFRCYLSTIRPQDQPNLTFLVVSQNGDVQLRIQANKGMGTTWEDIRWRAASQTIDVRLPRGFQMAIRCSPLDFRMLMNMYEYGMKMQALLYPRQGESIVFRTTLPSFQYFDTDPQSRVFPKEAIQGCELALFEQVYKEDAATGPRHHHRGFRLAVITGPRTRTLNGVTHTYAPSVPFQFGFLRGENESPALLLKFDSSRGRGTMVFSFSDEKERLRFHSLIVGSSLNQERIFAELPLKAYDISPRLFDKRGFSGISNVAWKGVRVINDDSGEDIPMTVLADKLRILTDFLNGSVTDRVNVTPGELRIRLGVSEPNLFQILRLPQVDMTMAVAEAQVPKEVPAEMKQALEKIGTSRTVRSFTFMNTRDLHSFMFAITGFKVLYDGIAVSFAITRRRMVVPVHKKWEAGATRIMIVERDGVLQLLVYFEEFHYGHCMGLVLKRTDEFEAFGRNGKYGLKILDAKFPLPRVPKEKERERVEADGSCDDMAFLCLDLPEIPGEHDDISIVFDNDEDRTKLSEVLPAATKGLRS